LASAHVENQDPKAVVAAVLPTSGSVRSCTFKE